MDFIMTETLPTLKEAFDKTIQHVPDQEDVEFWCTRHPAIARLFEMGKFHHRHQKVNNFLRNNRLLS